MTLCSAVLAGLLEKDRLPAIYVPPHDGAMKAGYQSHVAVIDDQRVALSNRFFSNRSRIVHTRGDARMITLDQAGNRLWIIDLQFVGFVTAGDDFERLEERLMKGSASAGLMELLRLRRADVFKMTAIRTVPLGGEGASHTPKRASATLASVMRVVTQLSQQFDMDGLVGAALSGLRQSLAMWHVMYLQSEVASGRLLVVGSCGYASVGAGAEAVIGEGLIGISAATGRAIRVARMCDDLRVVDHSGCAASVPALSNAQSQIAVPVLVNGEVRGVLFAECAEPMAFNHDDELAMSIIAHQMGATRAMIEALQLQQPVEVEAQPVADTPEVQARMPVIYYAYDDSIFIDGKYVIKGVAGRLLYYMLRQYHVLGRSEFSNKEMRLETLLRLPMPKDNLEARLILLRRRLEARNFPVRLVSAGRGRVVLRVAGELESVAALNESVAEQNLS